MDDKKGTNQILAPVNAKIIATSSAASWVDESGIIITLARGNQKLEHAEENMEAIVKLSNGKKMPVLIDYTNILSLSREARLYYGNKENSEIVAACAVITNSLIGKLIANFHIGLNKANAPVKLFTDVTEARKWLKQFIYEDHQ